MDLLDSSTCPFEVHPRFYKSTPAYHRSIRHSCDPFVLASHLSSLSLESLPSEATPLPLHPPHPPPAARSIQSHPLISTLASISLLFPFSPARSDKNSRVCSADPKPRSPGRHEVQVLISPAVRNFLHTLLPCRLGAANSSRLAPKHRRISDSRPHTVPLIRSSTLALLQTLRRRRKYQLPRTQSTPRARSLGPVAAYKPTVLTRPVCAVSPVSSRMSISPGLVLLENQGRVVYRPSQAVRFA